MVTIIDGDFEWDSNKNLANINKHNISFEEAIGIFYLDRYISESYPHSSGEVRTFCTGVLDEVEITVVYTWRGLRIRIISARRASYEERQYYRQKC